MNTMFLEPARGRGGSFYGPRDKSILRKIRSVMEAFETISYICVLDRRARIIRMNDRFAALFGAESADSTGMSVIPYLKRRYDMPTGRRRVHHPASRNTTSGGGHRRGSKAHRHPFTTHLCR